VLTVNVAKQELIVEHRHTHTHTRRNSMNVRTLLALLDTDDGGKTEYLLPNMAAFLNDL